MNTIRSKNARAVWMVTLLSVMLTVGFSSVQAQEALTVGSVTLLLGQASVERDGKHQPLINGMTLQAKDTISTQAGALLQIKMNDQGLISLRESTQLHIACYQADCMKFELLTGQMRQVTGKMGQENKHKYRLNTPVAAIGVRGTDFITKATAEETWVSVIEGAIVAAPFGSGCAAEMLGICDSRYAASLTAQDKGLLNLRPGVAPVLMLENGPLQTSDWDTSSQKRQAAVDQQLSPTDAALILKDHPQLWALAQQLNQQVKEQLPSQTPDGQVSQLLYSTWVNQANGLAQAVNQVSANYETTVGDARYVLWRDTSTPIVTPQGKVDYVLAQSQANVISTDGTITPANISNGQLAIDFEQKRLQTQLQVQGSNLPVATIQSQGDLTRADGLFSLSTNQGGNIAGAISNNGQEVGYMLNQPLSGEVLKALTHWQAR